MNHRKQLIERLLSKIDILPNGCWQWMGSKDTRGYGRIRDFNSKIVKAHRISYEYYCGDIPIGREIDHLCSNHSCINPEHLEAVSHRVNVLRGVGIAANYAKRQTCSNGHLFSSNNTLIENGARRCKICRTEQLRRNYLNRRVK